MIALAAAIAAVAAIALAGTRSTSFATSNGSAYAVPFVTDTNPAPDVVETTLTADEANIDIGNGVTAHAQTFNGTIPGPTFNLNVGDRVIVHYQNRIDKESGVHWHGIELANGMDGTPFTQNMVPAGGDFLYEFTVHRPGIFWYHPHHHSSTNQVFKGLYGMILVKDPNEDALQASGTLPSDSQTFPIVLSDMTVCKNVGSNDLHTYNDNDDATPLVTAPWSGGAGANDLPHQLAPVPSNLCQGPAVNSAGGGSDPYPIDENGDPRGNFAAGDIPNIQTKNANGRVNEGQTVLTNGKNVGGRAGGPLADQPGGVGALAAGAETLNVQPGQGLRLELLNTSATRYMRLHLTNSTTGAQLPLYRVGGEGGLLNNAVQEGGTQGSWPTGFDLGEILVPPGSRADVVIPIPAAPTNGVLTLWTRDYNRTGAGFTRTATVPVMHLNLAGPTVSPAFSIASGTALRAATGDLVPTLGPPNGSFLNPATFTPAKLGSAVQNMQLTSAANVDLGVDGTFGTHDVPPGVDFTDAAHLNSSRYAEAGDTLLLTAQNATAGANHPFHLHGFSIQPVRLDAPPFGAGGNDFTWPYPEFRDNIDIPPGYRLEFRVKLEPRALADGITPGGEFGRWLFHCHIFFHATNGMLSELVVTDANGNEAPTVQVNGTAVTADQGGPASITGSYSDRDGDPVTLTASQGTVTDNGGGNWTWNHTAGAEETSKFVYITATDSKNLKGQAPFQLNINATAPKVDSLKVKPKKFVPGKGSVKPNRVATKKKKGAKIKFGLSKASDVAFTVKKLKPKKPKVKKKKFSRSLTAGAQSIKFTGRFKKKALPPGKYKLTATATDTGGLVSTKASTKFKIKRP